MIPQPGYSKILCDNKNKQNYMHKISTNHIGSFKLQLPHIASCANMLELLYLSATQFNSIVVEQCSLAVWLLRDLPRLRIILLSAFNIVLASSF